MDQLYAAAARLENVQFSPVRKVLERAGQLEAQGHEILHLEIGEPDFDTPQDIVDATVFALCEQKKTHYAPNRGLLKLRKNIARMLQEKYGSSYCGESEILLTCGAAEAIFDVITGIVNSGDEVILMTPAYMNYENCINMAGASCIKIELSAQRGYQVDADALEKAITDKTRMIILTNPNNPTGSVLNRESLSRVAALARKHDLLVMADEIYSALVYEGGFTSFTTLEGMKERTILVSGFSKCFAMTGWRVGYVATDERLIPQILKVHQYVSTCLPTFIQEGLAEGMLTQRTARQVQEMVAGFNERRKALLSLLDTIGGLQYTVADSAFYAFVDVSATGLDGSNFATRLLEEKGVALVPGSAFGPGCENCVRISYGTTMAVLTEAMERIKEFTAELLKPRYLHSQSK